MYKLARPVRQCATAVATNAGRIVSAHPIESQRTIQVTWHDGMQADFHYLWLRDFAPSKRPQHLSDLTLGVTPKAVDLGVDGEHLEVDWPPWHHVAYSSAWLRQQATANDGVPPAVHVPQALGNVPIIHMQHNDHQLQLQAVTKAVQDCGVVQVQGGVEPVALMDSLQLSEGLVQQQEYTVHMTGLHTKGAQMAHTPRYTVLQVLSAGSHGCLQLVDGHHVANQCRHKYTNEYLFLANCAVSYMGTDTNSPAWHPVVQAERGHVTKVVFNNALRSCEMRLSPTEIPVLYSALRKFSDECYRNAINVQPISDSLFIIDNHRMLMGSTAFLDDPLNQCTVKELLFQ